MTIFYFIECDHTYMAHLNNHAKVFDVVRLSLNQLRNHISVAAQQQCMMKYTGWAKIFAPYFIRLELVKFQPIFRSLLLSKSGENMLTHFLSSN